MTAALLFRIAAGFIVASWLLFALRAARRALQNPAGRARELRSFAALVGWMALGWGFVGYVLIAIAGGAVFPGIAAIAAPLACPDGQFQMLSQAYSYKPGQSGVTRHALCVPASGEQREVTGALIFYAGSIYTLLLMTLAMWGMRFAAARLKRQQRAGESDEAVKQRMTAALASRLTTGGTSPRVERFLDAHADDAITSSSDDLATRLQRLKTLHEQGLIGDDAYAAKQAALLKNL